MINQTDTIQQKQMGSINLTQIQLITSLLVSLIGLAITLFGIKYSFNIFIVVYEGLQNPDTLTLLIQKWSVLLKINEMTITIDNTTYPVDKLLVLIILGLGTFFLLGITLAFIQAGIKILSNSVNAAITLNKKNLVNLDYKLKQLNSLAEQGKISQKAYEDARDNYIIQKIMGDLEG